MDVWWYAIVHEFAWMRTVILTELLLRPEDFHEAWTAMQSRPSSEGRMMLMNQ